MKQLPEECEPYKRTPEFDESSVPKGLLRGHQTKEGTWGKIMILEGRLLYRILEPQIEEVMLCQEKHGVVEPKVLHEIEVQGSVRFFVEFFRKETA